MKKIIFTALFIVKLFSRDIVFAESMQIIAEKIRAEIEQTDPHANIGIKIRNLQTGEVVYQQNSGRYYNFASGLKFISIAAMQRYFGNDHQFISQITKKDDNYYLQINDPDFSTQDLTSLILKLKESGISNIKGNLYIIKDEFSLPKINENHMIVDSIYCYGAQVSKVHVDKNCVKALLAAPGKLGDRIMVWQPASSPYKIINEAIIVGSEEKPRIFSSIKDNHHYITGSFYQKNDKSCIFAVTPDNYKHLELLLIKLLKDNKIILSGKILLTEKQENTRQIVSIIKTFAHVAATAMQESDNFITDYFIAQFAHDHETKDWLRAGDLLKQYINQLYSVNLEKATIVDGSGLSRYNLLSVNNFDDLLSFIYQSEYKNDVLELLAKPKEMGTLKDRGKDLKLFAKTGTMTGISSIVGYVFDEKNIPYSFVIVTNNYTGSSKKYKTMEENIIMAVVE